jgi:hypothetical protein
VKGVHTSRGSTGLTNPFLREDVDPGVRHGDIRVPSSCAESGVLRRLGKPFDLDGVEPSVCHDATVGWINDRAAEGGVSDTGKSRQLVDFSRIDLGDELLTDDVHVSFDSLEVMGVGPLDVVDSVSDGHVDLSVIGDVVGGGRLLR